MTKYWPTFLQDNSRYPETVAEAVDRLMELLHGEASKLIDSCNQTLHLAALYNSVHPDDVSDVIIGDAIHYQKGFDKSGKTYEEEFI
ncbi:hypothetical protein GO003_009885 [Methylicorpusculum oleiharenae]|uniref:hypothetical protein n=1 Tax=Methylicorpusculum oleiharenae TaxID=1338687 RepID=UPI0013579AFF|nr:hypothetical protein [Methylicorpusculum oleiharenae]MCD2450701.1 hypothetical protein [Methylicorpusculum oleiharenae]